jgi:hypothetical protein
MTFGELEAFGRVKLSRHFCMRQFLYSEIAVTYGLRNIPDDPDLAIEAGRKLCTEVLEPITEMFGPIIVRSGFRSAALNQFGHTRRLRCASNARNRAYHIWDQRDDHGHMGAAACIHIPSAAESDTPELRPEFARFLHDRLPYHRMVFFRSPATLNIGSHEAPVRSVFSYAPKPGWIIREGDLFEHAQTVSEPRSGAKSPQERHNQPDGQDAPTDGPQWP